MVREAQIKDLDVLVSLFISENEHNSDLAPDVVRKTEDVLNKTELQDILSDESQLLIVSEHDGKVVGISLTLKSVAGRNHERMGMLKS